MEDQPLPEPGMERKKKIDRKIITTIVLSVVLLFALLLLVFFILENNRLRDQIESLELQVQNLTEQLDEAEDELNSVTEQEEVEDEEEDQSEEENTDDDQEIEIEDLPEENFKYVTKEIDVTNPYGGEDVTVRVILREDELVKVKDNSVVVVSEGEEFLQFSILPKTVSPTQASDHIPIENSKIGGLYRVSTSYEGRTTFVYVNDSKPGVNCTEAGLTSVPCTYRSVTSGNYRVSVFLTSEGDGLTRADEIMETFVFVEN